MEKTNRKISLIITIVFIVSLFIGVILLTYSKYLKNNNIYEEENNRNIINNKLIIKINFFFILPPHTIYDLCIYILNHFWCIVNTF